MTSRDAHVLVVDDDPVSLRFATEVLAAAGYRTTGCGSLADAHRAIAAARPAAVLCDLGLPDGNGLELRAAAPGLAFVATSAELSEARATELLRAGCRGVLQKPVVAARLVAAIDAACAHRAPVVETAEPSREDLVLDARAALEATGSEDIVTGLRTLLLAELPAHRDAIAHALATDDAPAARDVLHRLRSACGFCGATRLRSAGEALAVALAGADGRTLDRARRRFDVALGDTLAALGPAPAD